MSILELTGFTGKAQVVGVVRDVVFAGNVLEIRGIGFEDANRILNQLAVGLYSVTLPTASQEVPKQDIASRAPVENVKPATVVEPAKERRVSKKVSLKDDDLPGDLGQSGKGPDVPSALTEAVVETKAAPGGGDTAKDEVLVKKLGELSRFSDVVATLKDEGFETPNALIEMCQHLRDRVKAIGRVGNNDAIAERVPRVLEALEE